MEKAIAFQAEAALRRLIQEASSFRERLIESIFAVAVVTFARASHREKARCRCVIPPIDRGIAIARHLAGRKTVVRLCATAQTPLSAAFILIPSRRMSHGSDITTAFHGRNPRDPSARERPAVCRRDFWKARGAENAELDTFMAVSHPLTGRSQLDRAVGARLLEALAKITPSIAATAQPALTGQFGADAALMTEEGVGRLR
jgi:hypothetical protein